MSQNSILLRNGSRDRNNKKKTGTSALDIELQELCKRLYKSNFM